MPSQVTIKNVLAGTPWSNDHGTFHPFALTVDADGTEQTVEVNRKPDSPVLQPGQQVWVETKPGRNGVLRGKIVPPPEQQSFTPRSNGTPGHDDVTRRSIEKQVALKAAVEFHRGDDKPPVDVVQTAQIFTDWLAQS